MRLDNNNNPLITVITLCYNSSYLFETIDSVLEQTYNNIQYIVSDDGTIDFDADEVRKYIECNAKNNIKEVLVQKHLQNMGTVKNINSAIRLAKGKYIFSLSANDCFFEPNILMRWVAQFQKTNAAVITAYQALYDYKFNNLIKVIPNKREAKVIESRNTRLLYNDLTKGNYILGSCTARTRKSILDYGYFDEDYKLLEDYPMNLYLLRNGQVIEFWNQIVIKYRDGGISNAENHNVEFKKDCDLVFEKEIKKYAQNKIIATINYNMWKHRQKKMGEFINRFHKSKSNLERLLIYLLYPKRGIEKVVQILLKRG